MKQWTRGIVGVMCTAATALSFAYQAVDVNIGRSLAFGYSTNLDQRGFGLSASGLIGLAYDNDVFAPAVRYNIIPMNENAFLDNVYVNMVGYFANLGDYHAHVNALGFGGGARVKLIDQYTTFLNEPLYFTAGINYAPPGTTWEDGSKLMYWFGRFEYPVYKNTLAYVGYRNMNVDVTNDHGSHYYPARIDKTVFVGVHYSF